MELGYLVSHIGSFTDDAVLITEAEPIELPGPRIVWCNAAFESMSGYSAADVIGQTPRLLQGAETNPATRQAIRAGLRAWRVVNVTIMNYRKDGTPFWVDLHIQPVADETGWYHYWLAVQREVSASRQELVDAQSQVALLGIRNEELMSFAARVSHDLREPLRKLSLFSDMLMRGIDEADWAQVRQVGEQIRSASRRGHELVADILRLSLASRMELEIGPVDCRALVLSVLDDFRAAVLETGLEVSIEVDSVPVEADRAAMSQVVRNLIGNCIKHRAPDRKPTVIVTGRVVDNTFVLGFVDNGVGIPPGQESAIFQPFVAFNHPNGKSSGLGLSIVGTLAEKCGWDVRVSSNPGVGTKFEVMIPAFRPRGSVPGQPSI